MQDQVDYQGSQGQSSERSDAQHLQLDTCAGGCHPNPCSVPVLRPITGVSQAGLQGQVAHEGSQRQRCNSGGVHRGGHANVCCGSSCPQQGNARCKAGRDGASGLCPCAEAVPRGRDAQLDEHEPICVDRRQAVGGRPITLTQAAWRIGARVIAQSLRQWIEKWAGPWDQGGIGARSVEGALYQLQAALRRGARRVLLLDVAAYFDSISSQLVSKTLEHLGAPTELAPLLCSFYQQALRIFSFDGMLSNKWRQTCLGIPQGCPLSPCVAAAIAHTWAAYIRAGCPSVGITAFMDDRTCWLEPNSIADLHTAVERSNAVDRAFGFELSPEKCVVASLSDDVDALAFAQSQGFKNSTCMELLGVRLQFNGCG